MVAHETVLAGGRRRAAPPALPASTLRLEVALRTLPRTKQQKTPASSCESTNSPSLGPLWEKVGSAVPS